MSITLLCLLSQLHEHANYFLTSGEGRSNVNGCNQYMSNTSVFKANIFMLDNAIESIIQYNSNYKSIV